MEITNYDPAVKLWSFGTVTASIFPVLIVAESEHHIYQDPTICISKSCLPTFHSFCEAKQELVKELERLLLKASELEDRDAVQ